MSIDDQVNRLKEILDDAKADQRTAQETIKRKKENDEDFQFDLGLSTAYGAVANRIDGEINELLYA